jgi:hypothetical protein
MLLKDLPPKSVLHINVGGLLRDELHSYRKHKQSGSASASSPAAAPGTPSSTPTSPAAGGLRGGDQKMPSYGALLDEYLGTGRILPGYITAGIIRQKLESTGGIFPTPTIVSTSSSNTAPSASSSASPSSAVATTVSSGGDFATHPVYLIDGFPRTMDNVREYEARVGKGTRERDELGACSALGDSQQPSPAGP